MSQAGHRIEPEKLKDYLEKRAGIPVQIQELRQLRGEAKGAAPLKQFGYGPPLLVRYRVDGREVREVLHRIRRNAFGRVRDDDVSCLTINYLFFSLQRSGGLEGPFRALHDRFWKHYLDLRPGDELVPVIQPWFAWRALVLARPVWYPTIAEEVRRRLLTFARRVLREERYDYRRVNQYLEDA